MSWQHFKNAIVRTPCRNLAKGLTRATLGRPIYELAIRQHEEYITALQKCGLKVTVLDALEEFADSCFVEDTAICIPNQGIVYTRPGAESRRGEVERLKQDVSQVGILFDKQYILEAPGTLDGGDVMVVGDDKGGEHAYIGLSERTNKRGAEELKTLLLEEFQFQSVTIMQIPSMLHLKSGMTAIANNTCIATGPFVELAQKQNLKVIATDTAPLANCIVINNHLLYPKGYSIHALESFDFHSSIAIDISQVQKLDGALTCSSLRF